MRLTLRQEWKPRPLMSFLGFIDLKTGVSIALLFAMINKVAGVYGLIAVFTGGTLPQVSMYVYSILGLVGFVWGFRAVAEVSHAKYWGMHKATDDLVPTFLGIAAEDPSNSALVSS